MNVRGFTAEEAQGIQALLALAVAEDHVAEDATSRAVFSAEDTMSAQLVAREALVVAGVQVLPLLLESHSQLHLEWSVEDGQAVEAGTTMATISVPTIQLLSLERTLLNLLQRLCGVATKTRQYVEAVAGTGATILDTRKTTPGWRALDKYAVRCGGGQNHRMHLADAIMIKDNHIAACGSITKAIERVLGADVPIVVECDTLAQVEEAMNRPIQRLLLDNMSIDVLQKAVSLVSGKLPLEASGGVSLETVRPIAETGVDYISIGAITHSAVMVDIGMDTAGVMS